jgi:hypothetical protein
MTATEAAATIVQKSCTTCKALLISSKNCNDQWGKREVQGCSRLADATLDEGARFKVEVNGGVPVHIDKSFDKGNQHYRQVQPALPLVKSSSSFITAVVADQGQEWTASTAALLAPTYSANAGIPTRGGGSRIQRDVGDGLQDVKPKVVFLARNLSVITASNAKLCSERIRRVREGHDYHGRLNAATAAELQEQGASQDTDVQPQDRCVVGEDRAPAIFSFNVTTFGPSVEENHLTVCTELQRPWQEDKEYMEVLRVQHNKQEVEQYQKPKTDQPEA